MKTLIITIIYLFFNSYLGMAQDANGVQIEIDKATYKAKSSELFLEIRIKNTGTDTLRMVKPQFNHFDKNYRFSPYKYAGEIKKPYTLDIQVDKGCESEEEEEMMVPMQESPYYLQFTKNNLLILAPGEESTKYTIPLNLKTYLDLCEDGQFKVGLTYDPQYEKLTKKQIEEMGKLRAKIDLVFTESNEFIETIGWSNNDLKLKTTLLHRNLNSDKIKKSLTPIQTQSKKIMVDYKQN